MKALSTYSRLCLSAGLVVGAVATASLAGDSPAGATRVAKARKAPAAATAIQQASFADVVEDAGDSMQNAASNLTPRMPAFNGTPFRNASHHGEYVGTPQGGETYIVEDGDCNCRKCRKFRKKHRGDFDDCDDGCKHHGHGHGMCNYFACKFGCFIPTGHGGTGSPYIGHYARVYPQDVNYFDQRDGQLYGAQGYGAPIAVPLAPVVGHTYNYGWGVPSSRLTPISHLNPR